MAERFQTAYGFRLVIRSLQMQFAAAILNQTWLARHGKLLFPRRADHANLRNG